MKSCMGIFKSDVDWKTHEVADLVRPSYWKAASSFFSCRSLLNFIGLESHVLLNLRF